MQILVINSSAGGRESASRELVNEVVSSLHNVNLGATVTFRDLVSDPVPHLNDQTLNGVRGTSETEPEHEARKLSDLLVSELRAADVIVMGVPMYNFSIPSALKAWIDHVVRAGETFRYSETGPKGLLTGKKVIVAESSGGKYSEGHHRANDFQEPYLRAILKFIGLEDVRFVRAEKTALGKDERDKAIAAAKVKLHHVAGNLFEPPRS